VHECEGDVNYVTDDMALCEVSKNLAARLSETSRDSIVLQPAASARAVPPAHMRANYGGYYVTGDPGSAEGNRRAPKSGTKNSSSVKKRRVKGAAGSKGSPMLPAMHALLGQGTPGSDVGSVLDVLQRASLLNADTGRM
jgi:hypothetical protein